MPENLLLLDSILRGACLNNRPKEMLQNVLHYMIQLIRIYYFITECVYFGQELDIFPMCDCLPDWNLVLEHKQYAVIMLY